MFSTTLIVFRESLEAALFIGIIAAASQGMLRLGRWLSFGITAGVLASLVLAFGMKTISHLADGMGQDYFNIGVMICALCMLVWHCTWVSAHAREMASHAKKLGQSVGQGQITPFILSLLISLTVLREGAETVLFVTSLLNRDGQSAWWLLSSVLVGVLLGSVFGLLVFKGFSRIQTKHVFGVTNAMILLMAGSLASKLANGFEQTGLLSMGSGSVWDLSNLLPNDSALGTFLHALVGYEASPSSLQCVFYISTVALIWFVGQQTQHYVERSRLAAILA